ncbi:flagellar hook-length control protein FliK, partial [Cylindrospermopsis raciborskii CS-506_B]
VELGRVEVSIDRSRGEALVRVTAERADTLALLQRDARDLERALSDAGLGERGTSLSFSLGDGGAARDQAQRDSLAQGQSQGASSPRAAAPRDATGPLPGNGPLHRQGAAHRGLLDLAV